LDNVKGLCVVALVAVHVLTGSFFSPATPAQHLIFSALYCFLFTFFMPLFFFISGYFSKKAMQSPVSAMTKMSSILLLGVFCQLFARIFFHSQNLVGHTWYLLSLAESTVFLFLLRKVPPKILLPLSIAAGLAIAYCSWLDNSSLGRMLVLSYTITDLPLFLAGYCCPPNALTRLTSSRLRRLGFAGIAGVAAAWVALLAGSADFSLNGSIYAIVTPFLTLAPSFGVYAAPVRLFMYVGVVILCVSILAVMPRRRVPLLTTLGSRSLQVYLLHFPLLALLRKIPFAQTIGNWGTLILLSLALPLLLMWKPLGAPFRWIRQLPGKLFVRLGLAKQDSSKSKGNNTKNQHKKHR
jgi:fucose 4-O-acetylase-like acetyltransferase